MPDENIAIIKLNDDLTIHNMESCKKNLLVALESSDNCEIDLSVVKRIDITGLQLLIGLSKEAVLLNKTVLYTGFFTDDFIEELNGIVFNTSILTNGKEFSSYILETI